MPSPNEHASTFLSTLLTTLGVKLLLVGQLQAEAESIHRRFALALYLMQTEVCKRASSAVVASDSIVRFPNMPC